MLDHPAHLKRALMLSTCAFAMALSTGPLAWGAEAPADAAASGDASAPVGLEPVIVTAERRGVDIQRTPNAVTAISAERLDQGFVNNVADLNAMVPSLEVTKTSGFENLVTIRGVGSETPENSMTTVPGVALFIDGVYIANTISLNQTLFDVQSIEVLRGPQGALYGQSSIGGAITINTRQPQLGAFDASGDFSFGNYRLFRERAEVNIPLGDQLALRVSAQKYDHRGFTLNTLNGQRLDDAHDGSVKGALLWKPVDNFTATLTGMYYKSDQNGDAQKNIFDPEPDPRRLQQDYPANFELETQLYHLNLEYDFGGFSVKSVSAYQRLRHVQQENGSRSAFSLLGQYDDIAAWNTGLDNYTEEFDILSNPGGKLDWIVGVFGLYQRSTQFVVEYGGFTAPTAADLDIPPDVRTNPPSNLNYGNDSVVYRRSYSAFAQATYHVADNLRITAGARYNHDFFKDTSYNFSAFGQNTVINRNKDHVPTWRAEADYDLTPDNMLYASFARGYKPGGVNGSFGQVVIEPTFKPEKNYAYEIGSKNSFLDHALRLNVAAFYYEHKNFQYIQTDPVPFDAGISNIPDVRNYGVEVEAEYVGLEDHLRIGGTLALERGKVHGSYKTIDSTVANAIENNPPFTSPCAFGGAFYNPACWDLVIASARDIEGNTPPAMPKVSGSAHISYRWDVPGGSFITRAEYTYRGKNWARIFNEPSLDRVKSYSVVDLYFEYAPINSNLRVSLTATNLFDKDGVNSQYTDPYGIGQTSRQYIPPRQVIGTIAYAF
jgi:iron complex outermembrane recepter protein